MKCPRKLPSQQHDCFASLQGNVSLFLFLFLVFEIYCFEIWYLYNLKCDDKHILSYHSVHLCLIGKLWFNEVKNT